MKNITKSFFTASSIFGKLMINIEIPKKMKSILLIEDTESINVWVTLTLRSLKYKVISRLNGEEGWQAFWKEKPDLVLLDHDLPIMNGTEVLEKIRSHPTLKQTPVIMFTAKSDEETVRRLLSIGVQDYIIKPFDNKTLANKIEKVLNG